MRLQSPHLTRWRSAQRGNCSSRAWPAWPSRRRCWFAGRPSVDAVGAQLELEAGPARRPPWGEAGEQPALSCLGVGVGEAGPSRWRVSESLQQVDEPQWQQQRVPAGGEEAAGAAKLELVDGEVADSG